MKFEENVVYGPDGSRYCGECGTRVAQEAATCFFCGANLRRRPRVRSWPIAEFIAIVLVFLLVWGWWQTNGAASLTPTPSPTPVHPTATATPTPTRTPTPSLPPSRTPTPSPTPSPTPRRYVVQPGDTLIGIAGAFEVDIQTLAEANNISPDTPIRVGQELIIPPPQGLPTPTPTPTPDTLIINYRVQKGDTLALIAEAFQVPVEVLLEANQLADVDRLEPGMVIIVPLVTPVPTATPTPFRTPTPTPGPPYPAPVPVLPPDGARFSGPATRVLLSWTAVGYLTPHEAYQVRVEAGTHVWTFFTRTPSFVLPPELYPIIQQAGGHVRWRVQVIRRMGEGDEERSPASPWRAFFWQ